MIKVIEKSHEEALTIQKMYLNQMMLPHQESNADCAATVETVRNFLRKLKMELPFDPAIPLLGLYPWIIP